ncbi:sulfurtransferase TusA family protein [Priestia filamentosa]|uniref:Uncharacterized protein n=1 Tax=Priestia filamentosa TaxID=1402861 RepID=A0A1X7EF48_9BACI|nr:sulfurtransferase TusA family protein [Priestia filamentosa]AKO92880.1 hypothetical protein BEH_12765 [Priestia filamentosa]MDT3762934.1 sulfurtransferase TusA family protein [Priestia filamentosa]OXS69458.1 hypothetical protein B1B01_10845 [Priestia filamentosa]RJS63827.1 SirA family protein [Priestia filamentosa]WCM14025.1 sulfurtransferase TusA family protein [Priestia filamentosa]
MKADKVLDAKKLACPMPIIKTKKVINELQQGEILEVHVTDKGAKKDFTAWTNSNGHELLKQVEEDHVLMFWIKKG